MKMKSCQHIDAVENFKEPKAMVCEECVKTGDDWVHLRTCQSCGVTLCCDSSVNRHARKHFQETNHPVIQSSEPGEHWLWCYIDELYYKPQV
ncbi:MAG: UBP-type zinc finger domain-containing protein [Saprospiraceae bacterium]